MRARIAVVAAALGLFASRPAHATPRWVDRLLTLPGPVAGTIDLGGSFAHSDADIPPCGLCSFNGTGVNVEGVLGIASRVDLGLRVGFRGFDDVNGINEGAATDADAYGRFFDPLTYYGGGQGFYDVYGQGAVSNPEFKVRVRILDVRRVFELGVEARAILPFYTNTSFTQVIGVPMAAHLGRHVRIDFGAYSHFTFLNFQNRNRDVLATFDLPASFWFQVHDRVFLGPMVNLRWYSDNVYAYGPANVDVGLGFGLGVSLARFLDLKTQLYMPRVDDGVHEIGVSVGVGFYFGRE